MHPEETPNTPQTEGQTVPPEEQIIPTAGLVQEDEQTQGEQAARGDQAAQAEQDFQDKQGAESIGGAAAQAQSLARANPMPIGLAAAFVAGVVVGRIASRR